MKESKLHKINVLEKTDASALDSQDMDGMLLKSMDMTLRQ